MENDPSNIGVYFNCYNEIEGYYLDKNESIFKKCYNTCKTCQEGPFNCLSCNESFYLSLNNTCLLCLEPCKTCSNQSICLTCIDNYFLFSGKCYQCNLNCNTIEDDNCKCKSCNDGYYL